MRDEIFIIQPTNTPAPLPRHTRPVPPLTFLAQPSITTFNVFLSLLALALALPRVRFRLRHSEARPVLPYRARSQRTRESRRLGVFVQEGRILDLLLKPNLHIQVNILPSSLTS